MMEVKWDLMLNDDDATFKKKHKDYSTNVKEIRAYE